MQQGGLELHMNPAGVEAAGSHTDGHSEPPPDLTETDRQITATTTRKSALKHKHKALSESGLPLSMEETNCGCELPTD